MFNWIHHLLNPHCKDCRDEREAAKVCRSCEQLEMQLALERAEKEKLLNKILNPTVPIEAPKHEESKVSLPKTVPWNVRRQMLEQEDREKAKLMRDAPKPVVHKVSTEDLEKELNVVEQERENARQTFGES